MYVLVFVLVLVFVFVIINSVGKSRKQSMPELVSQLWAVQVSQPASSPRAFAVSTMHARWKIISPLLVLDLALITVRGELCNRGTGECKELTLTDCPVIFNNQHLISSSVKYCDEFNEIVCCPLPLNNQNQAPVEETRAYEKRKWNDKHITEINCKIVYTYVYNNLNFQNAKTSMTSDLCVTRSLSLWTAPRHRVVSFPLWRCLARLNGIGRRSTGIAVAHLCIHDLWSLQHIAW